MNPTEKQREAVKSREKSILVSASAGSGKTTAMVGRIISLIKDGADIGEMLIITFTKAAASDMRDKISRALIDLCASDSRYERQLRALPGAAIGTIDSWCAYLVRNYFYAVEADADYELMGAGEEKALTDGIIDKFVDKFIAESSAFAEFYDRCLSNRSDVNFKKIIKKVIDYAETRTNPEEWLEHCCDAYSTGEAEKETADKLAAAEKELFAEFRTLAADADKAGYDKLSSRCNDAENMYKEANFPRFYENKDERFSDLNREHRRLIDKLKKLSEKRGRISRYADTQTVFGKASAVAKFAAAVYNELRAEKKKRAVACYADFEHLALAVLRSESAGDEVRASYKYVFVDEYQDVNSLQDELIKEVSKRASLFIVGDVKQSIYAFRGSEPDIFLDKLTFPEKNATDKIILFNENFRSDEAITDYCNAVFSNAMTPGFGGIDYTRAALVCTGEAGKGEVKLRLLADRDKRRTGSGGEVYDVSADMGEKDEFECEMAQYIAAGIADRLEQPDENGRRVREKDIAVLYRSGSRVVDKLYELLKKAGINVFLRRKSDFASAWEIKALDNFIKALAFGLDERAVAGYLLSPLCGLSESELYRASACEERSGFIDRIKRYAAENDDAIAGKISSAFRMLEKYGETARDSSVSEIISEVIAETRYVEKILASDRGEQGVETLEKYTDYLQSLKSARSAEEYARYLENSDAQFEPAAPDGALQIMTVHMAKGLQFPYVFLIDCEKKFNMSDTEERCICDKKYGLCIKTGEKDAEGRLVSNYIYEAASRRLEKRIREEEMRILYVALTRAEKGLYCYARDDGRHTDAERAECFLDWLMPVSNEVIERADSCAEPAKTFENPETTVGAAKNALAAKLKKRFEYRYPYASVSVKTSVTELAGEETESAVISSDGDVQLMEKGRRMHEFMEKTDFFAEFSVPSDVQSPPDEEEVRRLKKAHETVSRILAAFGGKIYREKAFVYKAPDGSLVQGRVDLLAVNGKKALVADYKLAGAANISRERYIRQLNLYADAVENILGVKVTEMYLYSFTSGNAKKVERISAD